MADRPRIAVFSGSTTTICNSPQLVTSNKARVRRGLPPQRTAEGAPMPFDALRPQRLALPATVYVRQFSAHPLEADAAELYGPADAYVDSSGTLHPERQNADDVPVYEIRLDPEDGLYPLPYMAMQANGQPWDGDCAEPGAPAEQSRQPFYPDASRIFEEIDRLGMNDEGHGNLLSSRADFDFYRAAPGGGYKKGLPRDARTDVGSSDIPPEQLGKDFWPYRPTHLAQTPPLGRLAFVTNMVQQALGSGTYAGGIWLEGSPFLEETSYWLNLLIDSNVPIAANAAQRPHGTVSADGDRNIIDSVTYLLSRVWADESGKDAIGVVAVQDQRIFGARQLQKGDARPGGYRATGGHGGVIGGMAAAGSRPITTFRPATRHTNNSALALPRLPRSVEGVRREGARPIRVPVQIRDDNGLLPAAMPVVTLTKFGRYFAAQLPESGEESAFGLAEIEARIDENLAHYPLSGIVGEGGTPGGTMSPQLDAALRKAVFQGIPVVRVGRGDASGFSTDSQRHPLFVGGSNLTATKARLLLMAALLKLGSLPPAADPEHPTDSELAAISVKVAKYQEIFYTH
jgi:L-asparaginase